MNTTPPREESEMTTNKEHAAEVIKEAFDTAMRSGTRSTWACQIAQALADAGLLMPDLPRPMQIIDSNYAEFNEHIDVFFEDVRVYFAGDFGEDPENLTPAEAREHALALIAAADYAEQEQGDGA